MGYVRKAASARRRRSRAWRDRSHRGRRAGHVHIGVLPGTWETRSSPPREPEGATGTENPWSVGSAAWPVGSGERPVHESIAAGVVPPSEGNEARRDGRPGIGASHSTVEAGELTPEDPVKGRGCRMTEPLE